MLFFFPFIRLQSKRLSTGCVDASFCIRGALSPLVSFYSLEILWLQTALQGPLHLRCLYVQTKGFCSLLQMFGERNRK